MKSGTRDAARREPPAAALSSRSSSRLRRFVPYRARELSVDTIVHRCAFVCLLSCICLLCFVCLLLTGLFEAGLSA